MYSIGQEKAIFSLISCFVVAIQVGSFYILRDIDLDKTFLSIIGFNLALFIGMIFLAKWVWKLNTLTTAFKKVFVYELLCGSLLLLVFIISSQ